MDGNEIYRQFGGGGGGRAIPSQLSNVTSDGFGFASPLSV